MCLGLGGQVSWDTCPLLLWSCVPQHDATWRGQSRVLGHSGCSQDLPSASSSSSAAFPKEL